MVGRHLSSFLPVALTSILGAFGLGLTFYCVIFLLYIIYSLCRPIRSQVQLVRWEQLDQDWRQAVTSSQTSIDVSCTSVEQLHAIYLFKKTHQASWRGGCQVFVLADTLRKLQQKKWTDRFSLSLCGVHWQVSVNVKDKQRHPELKQLQSAFYPKPNPKRKHGINNVWLEDSKLAARLKFSVFFFMLSLFSVAQTTLNGCCFSCQLFCAMWIFLFLTCLPCQSSSAQTRPSAVSEAHSDISLRLPGI